MAPSMGVIVATRGLRDGCLVLLAFRRGRTPITSSHRAPVTGSLPCHHVSLRITPLPNPVQQKSCLSELPEVPWEVPVAPRTQGRVCELPPACSPGPGVPLRPGALYATALGLRKAGTCMRAPCPCRPGWSGCFPSPGARGGPAAPAGLSFGPASRRAAGRAGPRGSNTPLRPGGARWKAPRCRSVAQASGRERLFQNCSVFP